MACVRKRRSKWVADYRGHTGKRHWETYGTRKEAERALGLSTVAIKDGRYSAPNDKRTVADAFDSWFKLCVEGSDNRSGKPLRLDKRESARARSSAAPQVQSPGLHARADRDAP